MRSLLVLPILALARGSLTQDVSSSDSPSSSVDPVVTTDTSTSSSTPLPNDPSTTPTDSSEPAVITTTPTASDSLVTSITSSEQASSTDSASSSASVSTDVDDPQATYVIPPDYYDVADVDEGVIVDVAPTMEEAVDLGAMEVDAYADVVADAKLAEQDNPNDVTKPVLPVCPNVKAAAARRAIKLPTFSCGAKSLSIKVNWNLVLASSKTSDTFIATARARVERNMELLNQVYNPFGISFIMSSWETLVAKWFTDLKYVSGDGFDATQPETQTSQAFMQSSRRGTFQDLNVWVVNEINVINADRGVAGFATFPNWGKKHDGIVIKQSALSPAPSTPLLMETTDQASCLEPGTVPMLKGSTLIHEVGHWLGLKHVHEGGCNSDDGVADTNQVADGANKNCCFQESCKFGVFRVINWMSYSKCRGTSIYNRPHNPSSFTDGQRSRMFAQHQLYRTGYKCGFTYGRRDLLSSAHTDALERRRAEDKAKVLADLLLHNCSVAIQDVFEPDTIPLGKGDLDMYSSSASFLQANPTPVPDGVAKPETVSYGTSQPTATNPGGGGVGGTNGGGGGGSGSGNGSGGTPKPSNGAGILQPMGSGFEGAGALGTMLWAAAMAGLGFLLL